MKTNKKFSEMIKDALRKDSNGELNLVTVMAIICFVVLLGIAVKSEIMGYAFSTTIFHGFKEILGWAVIGVGSVAASRVIGPTVTDFVNNKRAKGKDNPEENPETHVVEETIKTHAKAKTGINLLDKYIQDYVGLTEFEGLKHNPRIIEIFKRLGWFDYYQMKTDEHSWCASIPADILKRESFPTTTTKPSAAAKSFLTIGQEITVAEAAKILDEGHDEDYLMVAVFHRPSGGPNAGHVIMLKHIDKRQMATYAAGNESNKFTSSGTRSLQKGDLAGIRLITKSNLA